MIFSVCSSRSSSDTRPSSSTGSGAIAHMPTIHLAAEVAE